MNDQAQLAAVLLAGFFATGDPVPPEAGLAGSGDLLPRAKPEIVEISDGSCNLVTAHQAREDVAFRPGVTVAGGEVVSADLPQNYQYSLRPIYEFEVRINPLPNNSFSEATEMDVATIGYEPVTGRVLIDGEEIMWMHENALQAACESHINVTPQTHLLHTVE
ncbi:MAG: hypothetical protein COA62_00915 [Rhodobiaceae bacterium]|nr:MAG: hypothetical protein COA62_00915 [Rhodobiaceae bacterium]